MAEPVSVACPHCGSKLKLRDRQHLGRKVKCPKCSEPFVAKAAKAAAAASAADDDFGLFDEDLGGLEDDFSEQPQPASGRATAPAGRRSSTRSRSGTKKGGKKGKSRRDESHTNVPLLIGVGVLAVLLLVGVGLWAGGVFSGDDSADSSTGNSVADTGDETGVDPSAVGYDPTGGTESKKKANRPAKPKPTGGPSRRTPGGIDFAWLPDDTELLVYLRVSDVWNAPLLQSVRELPQVVEALEKIRQQTGLGPADIESVTIGVAGLDQLAAMGAGFGGPNPGYPPGYPGGQGYPPGYPGGPGYPGSMTPGGGAFPGNMPADPRMKRPQPGANPTTLPANPGTLRADPTTNANPAATPANPGALSPGAANIRTNPAARNAGAGTLLGSAGSTPGNAAITPATPNAGNPGAGTLLGTAGSAPGSPATTPGSTGTAPAGGAPGQPLLGGAYGSPSQPTQSGGPRAVVVVRTTKPVDPAALKLAQFGFREVKRGGKSYFRLPVPPAPGQPTPAVFFPDSKVIVSGDEPSVLASLQNGANPGTPPGWQFVNAKQQLVVGLVLSEKLRGMMASMPIPSQSMSETDQMILQSLRGAAFGLSLNDGLTLEAAIDCSDARMASEIHSQITEALNQARMAAENFERSASTLPATAAVVGQLAANLKTEEAGRVVRITSQVPASAGEQLVAVPQELAGMMAMAALAGGGPNLPFGGLLGQTSRPGDPTASGPLPMTTRQPTGQPAVNTDELPDGMKLLASAAWGAERTSGSDGEYATVDLGGASRSKEVPPPPTLELNLFAMGGPAERAVAYGYVSLHSVETDSGALLKRIRPAGASADENPLSGFVVVDRNSPESDHPPGGVHIPLEFAFPGQPVQAIKAIEGEFTLRVATNQSTVTIPDLASAVRQPVNDPQLQAAGFQMRRHSNGITQFVLLSVGPQAALGELRFVEPSGRSRPAVLGTMTVSGVTYKSLPMSGEYAFNPGLGLQVTLYTDLTEIRVPFRFENLEIPEAPPLTDEQKLMVTWVPPSSMRNVPKGVRLEAQARWSRRRDVDSRGRDMPPALEVAVDVFGEQARQAFGIGMFDVSRATTDSGASLRPRSSPDAMPARGFIRLEQSGDETEDRPLDGVRAVFRFEPPSNPIRSVATLQGSFRLLTAEATKTIVLEDVLSRVGKSLTHPQLRAAKLYLRLEENGNQLIVFVDRGNPLTIRSLTAIDAQGTPIPDVTAQEAEVNNRVRYILEFPERAPEGVGLQMVLNEGMKRVTIPVRFENLKVPSPPKRRVQTP